MIQIQNKQLFNHATTLIYSVTYTACIILFSTLSIFLIVLAPLQMFLFLHSVIPPLFPIVLIPLNVLFYAYLCSIVLNPSLPLFFIPLFLFLLFSLLRHVLLLHFVVLELTHCRVHNLLQKRLSFTK